MVFLSTFFRGLVYMYYVQFVEPFPIHPPTAAHRSVGGSDIHGRARSHSHTRVFVPLIYPPSPCGGLELSLTIIVFLSS